MEESYISFTSEEYGELILYLINNLFENYKKKKLDNLSQILEDYIKIKSLIIEM